MAVAGREIADGRGLAGARVALLEGRMGQQLAELVRRHNGIPLVAPAVREVALDASDEVCRLLDGFEAGRVDIVLCLTGAGVDGLFAAAERLGRLHALEGGLRRATTVCRGHKPRAALKRRGLPASVLVPEPYTTSDVLRTLATVAPPGREVAVLHYGERNPLIGSILRENGSDVLDVCVYEWALPEDTGPLEALIEAIIDEGVEAAAFTSQVQVRHLLAVASRMGRTARLIDALNTRAAVAAVGPTCADALAAVGVTPRVVPHNPKMGPMIVALAEYLSRHRRER